MRSLQLRTEINHAARLRNEIAATEDKERISQAKEDGLNINSTNPVGKDLLLDEIQKWESRVW